MSETSTKMEKESNSTSLNELIDLIDKLTLQKDSVSIGDILQIAGQKSFGTLLFLAGTITLAPLIGDIPGVPTLMGIIVFLTSVQMLLQKDNLRLPQFILKRSVDRKKLHKTLNKLKRPVKFIDRLLKPRLNVLTEGFMLYVIAVLCLFTALLMPIMEFIPFSANIAGFILTFFGLSIATNDGLPALITLILIGIVLGFLYHQFVF